jgi:TRAP-type C4-dicarboxylate transport system substrate-binding protein
MSLMRTTRSLCMLLLAMPLFVQPALAAKVLRYSDHEPLGGMRTRFLNDVFLAAVEKESQGRLSIERHWDSEIATGYDALKTLKQGVRTDLAIVVPEYTADELPLHQLFKSFPVGPSGAKRVEFFRRVFHDVPEFSTELNNNNIVPLFLATGYPVAFFSTSPMTGLQDLDGHKWRSASFWHQDFLQHAGATPVSMHWGPEIYQALQNKTLDGIMVNVDSGVALKVHETAPNVLVSRDLWLGHLYLLAMNRDTWNGLAKEDQQAILRAAEYAYRSLGAVMDQHLDSMLVELQHAGAKVRTLTPEEVRGWQDATDYLAVQNAWVKKQEAKGLSQAGSVLASVRAILAASLQP